MDLWIEGETRNEREVATTDRQQVVWYNCRCACWTLHVKTFPLFELDQYVDAPVVMMAAVEGDTLDPAVESSYRVALDRHSPGTTIERLERFDFYDRTRQAFIVIMTGETAKYGNILLKKGVTPLD